MKRLKLFDVNGKKEAMEKTLHDFCIYTDITPMGLMLELSEGGELPNDVLAHLIKKECKKYMIKNVSIDNIVEKLEEEDSYKDIFIDWDGYMERDDHSRYLYVDDSEEWFVRPIKSDDSLLMNTDFINYIDSEYFDEWKREAVVSFKGEKLRIWYNEYVAMILDDSGLPLAVDDYFTEKELEKFLDGLEYFNTVTMEIDDETIKFEPYENSGFLSIDGTHNTDMTEEILDSWDYSIFQTDKRTGNCLAVSIEFWKGVRV